MLLKKLQDSLYDLEDLLDEFEAEALLHQIKEDPEYSQHSLSDSAIDQVISFVGSSYDTVVGQLSKIKHDLDFSSRIKEINERLENILSQTKELGLSYITQQPQLPTHSKEVNSSRRESTSLTCEPLVYGRDVEKWVIFHRLLNEDPNYGNFIVIPIVGKGGIGKTTLAQSVYNNQQVNDHFQLKAWVCVSDVFDTKRITTSIENSATGRKIDFSDLNQAHTSLAQVLKDKRFLIVLDDVWSEKHDDWCSLVIPFRLGAKGSRVIATTRSQKAALNMNPSRSSMILLKGLSNDDCWRLFLQHAFEDAVWR